MLVLLKLEYVKVNKEEPNMFYLVNIDSSQIWFFSFSSFFFFGKFPSNTFSNRWIRRRHRLDRQVVHTLSDNRSTKFL